MQCEMEAERLANQFDYWLVQYQRLLDNKPTELEFLVHVCRLFFSMCVVGAVIRSVVATSDGVL
jgi:hypothetical protein